jgi:D-3-phosphoglycerate dehydrogenase
VRILLTTTSYQDTPGEHHRLLDESGLEVVRARGPLSEPQLLELIKEQGPFDATLNGDDAFTPKVIDALEPQLKCLAKYGIGLDSIDVEYATSRKLPVLFTPGVNHTTVAEHAIGLMIAAVKHFWPHMRAVKQGMWKRQTGNELAGKTLAVLGMGRIGKETARRAKAFDMSLLGFDVYWDEDFARELDITRCQTIEQAVEQADVISLHLPATDQTRQMIDSAMIQRMRDSVVIVNTARGTLIDEQAVAEACKAGKIKAYAADVLAEEPMNAPHPFQEIDNIIITPHVGSRTYESVERQAVRATLNVVNFLKGDEDFIQANSF